MRFRDFDIGVSPGDFAEVRTVNTRYRAFVEAVVAGLSERKVAAPWIKLYVSLRADGQAPWFMPALPKVGLSAAGVTMRLPDPALLTAEGEAVRPVLARVVVSTRDLVRERSGWDDEGFWASVTAAGQHRGPFERRVLPTPDRRAGVVRHLTYAWDELGTTVFVDARRSLEDETLVARVTLDEFPDQWDLGFDAGFSPRRLRIAGDRVEVCDRAGALLGSAPKPG